MGDTLERGGWHQSEGNKSDSDSDSDDTSVAAPGVTHTSDATGSYSVGLCT